MPEDILKPNQQRKLQPPGLRFFDHIAHVHGCSGVLQRRGDHFAGITDVEVFRAPSLDIVEISRSRDVPDSGTNSRIIHFNISIFATIGPRNQNAISEKPGENANAKFTVVKRGEGEPPREPLRPSSGSSSYSRLQPVGVQIRFLRPTSRPPA